MTPPALPGEMWRGVLDAGNGARLYAVRENSDVARVNVWREGPYKGDAAWHVAVDDEWPIVLLAALRVYRSRADAAEAALAELRRAVERLDSAYLDAEHYPAALAVLVDVARGSGNTRVGAGSGGGRG